MKFLHLILFLFFCHSINAQCILDYEKEINDTSRFNYEEIDFLNEKDKVKLSGTLISPKDGYEKIVIIVPGSGKDSRHAHFILVEKLLDNKIAVYRFDERGIGKSKGKYNYHAASLASDVEYCFNTLNSKEYLKDKNIGVIGHSLGGLASIISYKNKCDYDFMILLGTPIQKDGAFIKHQAECNSDGFYTVKDKSQEEVIQFVDRMISVVLENKDKKSMRKSAKKVMEEMDFNTGMHLVINPLQIELIRLDHEQTIKDLEIPLLYLIGSEDKIVNSKNEIEVVGSFENENIDYKIVEETNHWLSPKISPNKMELELYHMKEEALNEITNWIIGLDK